MELSSAICVCADIHVDVLVGQRPVAAFRQELIEISSRNCSILCVSNVAAAARRTASKKAASSTFITFSKSDVASCWLLTLKERISPHHPGVLYPVAPFYNSM